MYLAPLAITGNLPLWPAATKAFASPASVFLGGVLPLTNVVRRAEWTPIGLAARSFALIARSQTTAPNNIYERGARRPPGRRQPATRRRTRLSGALPGQGRARTATSGALAALQAPCVPAALSLRPRFPGQFGLNSGPEFQPRFRGLSDFPSTTLVHYKTASDQKTL